MTIFSRLRANGIGTGEVWEIDASKQTTRVSANVSGLLGTERITLNDNLLNRASLPEIESIMAHEMGHYVLNHVYKMLLQLKGRVGGLRFFWSVNPALLGALLFTIMIVAGPLPVPARADTIRLGGTGGALGGMKLLAEEFKKSHPGDTVIILPSMGSSGGINAVLSGALDIGLGNRALTGAEQGRGLVVRDLEEAAAELFGVVTSGAVKIEINQQYPLYDALAMTYDTVQLARFAERFASTCLLVQLGAAVVLAPAVAAPTLRTRTTSGTVSPWL